MFTCLGGPALVLVRKADIASETSNLPVGLYLRPLLCLLVKLPRLGGASVDLMSTVAVLDRALAYSGLVPPQKRYHDIGYVEFLCWESLPSIWVDTLYLGTSTLRVLCTLDPWVPVFFSRSQLCCSS